MTDANQPVQQNVGEGAQSNIPFIPNNPKTTEIHIPKSSWIAKVEYDSSSFRLTITTHAGAQWQKVQVYPQMFQEMKLHPSAGQYINTTLRQHATVHVKRLPKLDEFPTHGGEDNATTKDTFKNPTNKRFSKIKGRYS